MEEFCFEYKLIFVMSIVILFILLSGCTSFSDCERSCYYRFDEDFEYEKTHISIHGVPFNITQTNTEELKKMCFEKCVRLIE